MSQFEKKSGGAKSTAKPKPGRGTKPRNQIQDRRPKPASRGFNPRELLELDPSWKKWMGSLLHEVKVAWDAYGVRQSVVTALMPDGTLSPDLRDEVPVQEFLRRKDLHFQPTEADEAKAFFSRCEARLGKAFPDVPRSKEGIRATRLQLTTAELHLLGLSQKIFRETRSFHTPQILEEEEKGSEEEPRCD